MEAELDDVGAVAEENCFTSCGPTLARCEKVFAIRNILYLFLARQR